MRKRNALDSLHGAIDKPREQEILTPPWLPELLRKEWGSILLDPCAPRGDSSFLARSRYCGGEHDNGLIEPWLDRTYCNPPYRDLKLWLAKARAEAVKKSSPKLALLVPARTSRKWYRAALDDRWVVELDPVKFHGFDAGFPAPLHLICFNWRPDPKLWTMGTVRYYPKGVHNGQ